MVIRFGLNKNNQKGLDEHAAWHDHRAGLRGGNGGNCPGHSAPRVLPMMTFICFKWNIRLKNRRDSKEIQEYNAIFRCCVEYH